MEAKKREKNAIRGLAPMAQSATAEYRQHVISAATGAAAEVAVSGDIGPAPRLEWIEPRSITPNPANPRVDYGDGDLHDLSEDMRRRGGNVVPVLYHQAEDGLRYLIAGHRRREAAIRAGTPLLAMEFSGDDVAAAELMAIENLHRRALSEYERCRAALILQQRLLDYQRTSPEIDVSYRALAVRLGVASKQTVANWISVARGVTDVMLLEAGYYLGSAEQAAQHDKVSVSTLTQARLMSVSKLPTTELKVAKLRELTSRAARAGADSATPEQPPFTVKRDGKLGVRGISLPQSHYSLDAVQAKALLQELRFPLRYLVGRAGTFLGSAAVANLGGSALLVMPTDETEIAQMDERELDDALAHVREYVRLLQAAVRARRNISRQAVRLTDAAGAVEHAPEDGAEEGGGS